MRFIKNNLFVSSLVGLLVLAVIAGAIYTMINPGPTHIRNWNELSTLGYEETAVVYIYLDSCGACNSIKDDVYEYFDTLDSRYAMYMIDGASISGTAPQGVPNAVPAILVIENGRIITARQNVDNVLAVFSELAE